VVLLIALRGRLGGDANKAQPAIKTIQIIWNAWASPLIVKPERLLALGSAVSLFSPITVSQESGC